MSLNPDTFPTETPSVSLAAVDFTANADGTGVDIKDYVGKLKVVINAAAAGNDNQPIAVTLQTSHEASANYVAFDPALEVANLAANAPAQVVESEVDTALARRYVRAVLSESAAGNGRVVSVTLTGKKQVTA